jgi:hypothetical protein
MKNAVFLGVTGLTIIKKRWFKIVYVSGGGGVTLDDTLAAMLRLNNY